MPKLSNDNRTTSLGLLNMSKDYLKAFNILENNSDFKKGFSRDITFFLFCHGIELGLKAYLKSEKYSLNHLKSIGHDLKKLYILCKQKGIEKHLSFTQKDITVFEQLNLYYKNKDFEYSQTGFRSYPDNLTDTYDSFYKYIGLIFNKCFESAKTERSQ